MIALNYTIRFRFWHGMPFMAARSTAHPPPLWPHGLSGNSKAYRAMWAGKNHNQRVEPLPLQETILSPLACFIPILTYMGIRPSAQVASENPHHISI
ncbi:hypothetical protein JCM17845_02170 [Iodidimonas gelatinilytica]|uniref:Uncharacterized protein n=1 Tax=Iodidimonas gelatinilytica TaxID=1236966 RepID=A0A5A7MW83_9PROT|nr:hypothetical protein JCM17845_02170 [Iodidimonas gelatinilytica]